MSHYLFLTREAKYWIGATILGGFTEGAVPWVTSQVLTRNERFELDNISAFHDAYSVRHAKDLRDKIDAVEKEYLAPWTIISSAAVSCLVVGMGFSSATAADRPFRAIDSISYSNKDSKKIQ